MWALQLTTFATITIAIRAPVWRRTLEGRGRNSVRFHRLSTPAASQSKGHLLLVSNKIVPFKYILYLYHSKKYVLKQIKGSYERL